MVADLAKRGDNGNPGRAATAVDQEGGDACGRGAGEVLGRRVADHERLRGFALGDLEPGRKDRRVGLAVAGGRGGDGPLQVSGEADLLEDVGQRAIPVRDADEGEAAL